MFASEAFAAAAHDGFIVARVDNARLALAAGWAEQGACGLVGRGPPISWGSDEYKARPAGRANLRYFAAPILNIFVPQTGHLPSVAGRPFFIVIWTASLISRLVLHFTQYASAAMFAPIFPGSMFLLVLPEKPMA